MSDELSYRVTDYLNRDWDSFDGLLARVLERSKTNWKQRSPADPAVMLMEILAYDLDHLAYAGDRVAAESFLRTARLRESIRKHAALAGYEPTENQAGTGFQRVHLKKIDTRVGVSGMPDTEHIHRLPARTVFAVPGTSTQPATHFESVDDALVSYAWNTFKLTSRSHIGDTSIAMKTSDTSDLRRLSLSSGLYLAIGEVGETEIVQILEVGATDVELQAPITVEHPESTPIYGNIVPIREGRTMLLGNARCGALPGSLSWGTFLTLRMKEVVRASDELELARMYWRDHFQSMTSWRSAHNKIRAVHDELRGLPRVLLQSPDDNVLPRNGQDEVATISSLDQRLLDALADLDDVRRHAGIQWSARIGQERVTAENQRVPLSLGQPLLWIDTEPVLEVRTGREGGEKTQWTDWNYQPEFLRSNRADRHVILEIDNASEGVLVFPDGVTGALPEPGDLIEVRWASAPPVSNNARAGQIRILIEVPERQPAADGIKWVVDDIDQTQNVTTIQGSSGPEAATVIRRNIRLRHAWTAAPATEEDYHQLVLEQDGVAEAYVGVEEPIFTIAIRPEDDAPASLLDDLRATLADRRQADTFFEADLARKRGVRMTLLAMPDGTLTVDVTRRRIREALADFFKDRLGESLGRRLAPSEIESAFDGLTAWTDVYDLNYASAPQSAAELPRILTVAPDRYLDLEDYGHASANTLTLLIARAFTVDLEPDDALELSPDERVEVFRLLSGPTSALNQSTESITRRRIEETLRARGILARVLTLLDNGTPTNMIVLGSSEVPFLVGLTSGLGEL